MFYSLIMLFLLSLINYVELKYCDENCKNGICFEPNTCICHPGFGLSSNHDCVPKCSDGCFNGVCIEPEICECFEGYVEVKGSYNKCEPEFDMLTEQTTAEDNPDEEYLNGDQNKIINFDSEGDIEENRFEIDDNSTESNIEDSVDYEFINDDEFNKWIAINKYEKNHTNTNIEDKRFENESAETNDKCQVTTIDIFFDYRSCKCIDGYGLKFNKTKFAECVPLCNNSENGCVNGYCVGPDVCLCLQNYQQNSQNEFECLPRSLNISDRWTFFTQTYFITLIILAGLIFVAMQFLRKFSQQSKYLQKPKGRNSGEMQQTRV